MGMHTKANEIVKEHGFIPGTAHSTTYRRGGDRVRSAESLAAGLNDFLTREGLIRFYAPLKAAQDASPRFQLGDGPRTLVDAIEKKIGGDQKNKEILQEIQDLKKQLADLEFKVKAKSL